ncbi:MAG TPA: hypothetical protein VKD21_09990 [Acidimicrobiales bacterium]|nr:hypothetical protein [Acidimicrobiales bacterium]
MKLGFITACLPKRTLTQLCEWAAAEGYEAGGSCAAFDRIEAGSLYAATYLYSPTMAGSAVNMARLIAQGRGFSDLIEPEVPSQIVVPPTEVNPDNVDDLRDLCFE